MPWIKAEGTYAEPRLVRGVGHPARVLKIKELCKFSSD